MKNIKNVLPPKYLYSFYLFLFSTFASATTSIEMTFADLVHNSDACVVASVMDVNFVEEQGGVYTYTKFRVKETAFGNPSEIITVKTPGGERQLGRLPVAEVVPGAPRFFKNQDNLLFLSQNSQSSDANEYQITGFSQGAMTIRDAAAGSMVQLSTRGDVSIDEAMDAIQEQREANDASN